MLKKEIKLLSILMIIYGIVLSLMSLVKNKLELGLFQKGRLVCSKNKGHFTKGECTQKIYVLYF